MTLTAGAGICHLPLALPLRRGGELRSAVLAFERQGPPDAPVVLVLGGISAGAHVSAHLQVRGPGWWEGFVGDGLPIDTRRWQVLGVDWLGGAGASTAPRGSAPFPLVDTCDQARAIVCLLDQLRIERLHAVIGCSYGGMVGLQLAAAAPGRLRRLLCIAAAHRSHALANAWRALQRSIVELGVQHGCADPALALARGLAMTTYRSALELGERFSSAPAFTGSGVRLPVQDWLEARGAEFVQRTAPAAFLCLSASIDAHAVEPAAVRVPTSVCSFDTDQLVPPALVRELAAALPALIGHRQLRSRYGHDAFLKERSLLRPALQEVLA
ncbi:MAG TPA: homoserine O-succinyltransferase [Planctomycetota bacterium]|nr:homoserine O-succinyltransferase [Planctomycetota bacterium]